jgi:mercuric ion transport protein
MNREINASRWSMMGAIGAAVAASLCCILPVAAAALRVAGYAASEFFGTWRPYLLALTVALLGLAFYLAYRAHTAACEPNSMCDRPGFVRSNRAALWGLTLLVIVFAAFPYYSGTLVRAFAGEPKASQATNVPTARVVLTIQGMDCTACAALIEKDLSRIQGVHRATVKFETKVATVDYDPRVVSPERFVKAIRKAEYIVAATRSQGRE